MAAQKSLVEALEDVLPLNYELVFYHISTPSTPCPALFSPSPGQVEEQTFCQSHFLAVSLPAHENTEQALLVFAIEVLIFTTQNLTTIFVSKADSTGYLQLHKAHVGSPSVIKTICSTFLSYLVREKLQRSQVLLSLFARSQNQYLFPGSVENSGKHVLDDRQLIKWWCRVIDPVLQEYRPVDGGATEEDIQPNITAEAFIIVPGCDRSDTKAFFPPSARSQPKPRWSATYPSHLLVPDGSAPPRCLIPRFPDDPKARFLDDLDSEIPEGSQRNDGSWKSVKSLEQFWEMMSYRQECSAGRLVGFVWSVFTASTEASQQRSLLTSETAVHEKMGRSNGAVTHLPTPKQSQTTRLDPIPPPSPSTNNSPEPTNPRPPPHSSPIPHLEARPGPPPHSCADKAVLQPTLTSETQTLLLPILAYQTLLSHLLTLDFSTRPLATSGTSSWLRRASELAAAGSPATTTNPSSCAWGHKVTGRKPIVPVPFTTTAAAAATAGAAVVGQGNGTDAITTNGVAPVVVNVLTGLRRKKKRKEGEMVADGEEEKGGEVVPGGVGTGEMWESGLIRKKVKSTV